ncbi:hypothetical protein [Granulicella pectinivorans]|uniref:hypothetical protein n=1 Tax=Granulicella pectinivorans TaxID=474950 RepID=UPI0011402F09|nr:hypothetical protein [Granulicella pectinivorans]
MNSIEQHPSILERSGCITRVIRKIHAGVRESDFTLVFFDRMRDPFFFVGKSNGTSVVTILR